MKKALILAVAGLLVFGFALSASAEVSYDFQICDDPYPDVCLSSHIAGSFPNYYVVHDYREYTFTLPCTAADACLEIKLLDKPEDFLPEKAKIYFDGVKVAEVEVDCPTILKYNYAALAPYLADSELVLKVKQECGDFKYDYACVKGNCVPLPGAVLLLGAGLARLTAYARRKRS